MAGKCKALIAVLFLGGAILSRSDAQALTNSIDIPVVVAGFNNKIVRGLGSEDFSVRLGDVPAQVGNVSLDDGPKRVALILDASRNIPEEEWKLQVESAMFLLKHARPNDRFAFLIVSAEGTSNSFLTADEVEQRLEGLAKSRPKVTEASERIYDAIFEAANRLSPSQFGDTIFLIGHHQDAGSKTSIEGIREVLFTNDLRFLGLSIAERLQGLPPGADLNKPLPKSFGPTELELVALNTGYYFSFHSVGSVNTPGQMPLFNEFLGDLYEWIAEPYRVGIISNRPNNKSELIVNIRDSERRKIHQSGIHNPRYLWPRTVPADRP